MSQPIGAALGGRTSGTIGEALGGKKGWIGRALGGQSTAKSSRVASNATPAGPGPSVSQNIQRMTYDQTQLQSFSQKIGAFSR